MKGKWYKKSLKKAETYTSVWNVDNRDLRGHFRQNLKVYIQYAYREIEVTSVFSSWIFVNIAILSFFLIFYYLASYWPDLKAVYSTYHRLTSWLPTWVEQSKVTYSLSTSFFPTILYSDTFISFLSLSSIFFFSIAHIFSSSFLLWVLGICI